jgi:hypothetical protein
MLLDIAVDDPLVALPLLLMGFCLFIYGREILEVLSFPIGALAGGVLAYMIMRGFLAPYEIPLIIEVLVAFVLVLLGGIMGPGTMVMVISVIISLAVVDVMNMVLGEGNEIIAWIIGCLFFAVMIYPVQRFLPFSSAVTGGVLISMGTFILIDGVDPLTMMIIQLTMIILLGAGGGLLQTWMKKRLDKMNEEPVWVPTAA